jgi:hypothetical protein
MSVGNYVWVRRLETSKFFLYFILYFLAFWFAIFNAVATELRGQVGLSRRYFGTQSSSFDVIQYIYVLKS